MATGCAALIFESLWFRQAGLAFGNNVWATTLVLAGFMAGLGLGNLVAARYGDRVRRPLLACAITDAAIAIAGPTVGTGPASTRRTTPWRWPAGSRTPVC